MPACSKHVREVGTMLVFAKIAGGKVISHSFLRFFSTKKFTMCEFRSFYEDNSVFSLTTIAQVIKHYVHKKVTYHLVLPFVFLVADRGGLPDVRFHRIRHYHLQLEENLLNA